LDGDCDGTDWLGGAYGDYCVIDGDPADNLQINPQTVVVDGAQALVDDGTLVNGTSVTVSDTADNVDTTQVDTGADATAIDIGYIVKTTVTSTPGDGQTPWHKNPCITGAIGMGLLHVGIDLIGLLPEGGVVSRAVGNYVRYRGIVATQQGTKAIQALKMGAGIGSTGVGVNDTSRTGRMSSGLGFAGIASTLAGAAPIYGQIISGASIVLDFYSAGKEIANCE